MKNDTIIIGTRSSALALWQSEHVASLLRRQHPSLVIELKKITTTGDVILDSPLSKIGDKGLFTKELDRALLAGEIDVAVHSLKDVPTRLNPGLILGAISEREDVRDVFIAHPKKQYASFNDVSAGGTIATGSLRRKCQLLSHRPDLAIVDIRGNLKTRMQKLEQSNWDGMLLAYAGVLRLGWTETITEIFSPTFMLPAVGQGALGIEIRENDADLHEILRPLNHYDTERAAVGERALLRRLEGGCQIPIGTYGRIENGIFSLDAIVGSVDGRRIVRRSMSGPVTDAEHIGVSLAEELLKNGADEILDDIRRGAV